MEELQTFVTVFVKLPLNFDEKLRQYMKKKKVLTGQKCNKATEIIRLAQIGLLQEKL